ncbi:MAG TPA: glycerate kinase [Tepidisphaeraceae bacterium]|nr:glycerate kinase [Tepidisphaeraceae bacterium]
MRILIAPDKFKGCLTALEVAQAMAEGIRRVIPDAQIDLCPMADGGEGTVSALVAATKGKLLTRRVTGPLPEMKVDATFGMLGDGQTAVVEMAAACGLALLPTSQRDPMATTTFGTGELLLAAAEAGAKHVILGIGGSATVDGGVGCAQACGLPVLLEDGEPVSPTEPLCGRDLDSILMIKHGRGSPIERMQITVACDVVNPLFGPNGAAVVFGPQKGATPPQVKQLDDSLRRLAERTGKLEAANTPGAGAAGGLGFGMLAWFGATLASGVQTIIDAVDLQSRLRQSDLCITGEGKLDEQTLHGKTPIGVARAARKAGVPCIALAGSLGAELEPLRAEGLDAWFSICPGPMTLEQSMSDARRLLADAAANAVSLFNVHHSDERG